MSIVMEVPFTVNDIKVDGPNSWYAGDIASWASSCSGMKLAAPTPAPTTSTVRLTCSSEMFPLLG